MIFLVSQLRTADHSLTSDFFTIFPLCVKYSEVENRERCGINISNVVERLLHNFVADNLLIFPIRNAVCVQSSINTRVTFCFDVSQSYTK